MDEAVLMEEVDSSDCLDEEVEGGFLSEAALFFDQHKQVTLGYILHDQVNVIRVF